MVWRSSAAALVGVGLAAGTFVACGGQEPGLGDERLATMVDSLLPSIAEASGLEVRRPVQFAVQDSAAARAFMERQLDEELGPEELDGMLRAYRGFGLLPDTLDLRSLMLELLTEQVVGYYDPKVDRLYVVEGVAPEAAEPVVAHELVHALQDQHTDLDALIARDRGNDRQMAAQAAAEGQALLVMIALQAARSQGSPVDPAALPDLGPMLRPGMEAENSQFPVFRRSPRLIRETLVFPYLEGATFLQELYRATDGIPIPFDDLLPQSTEQILDPRGRFIEDRDHPTEIELDAPAAGWTVSYDNTLGQLETGILLREHLGEGADVAARGWDGDRYALVTGPDEDEALVWYSVWDDDAAADRFAAAYRRVLERRPDRGGRVERLDLAGRPGVRIVEVDAGGDPGVVGVPPVRSAEERPRV
jgi:hypothetical protein